MSNSNEKQVRRLWFASPRNEEELQEAVSFLKGLCEECLLGRAEMLIEVSASKRTPRVENLLAS